MGYTAWGIDPVSTSPAEMKKWYRKNPFYWYQKVIENNGGIYF